MMKMIDALGKMFYPNIGLDDIKDALEHAHIINPDLHKYTAAFFSLVKYAFT